MLIAFFIMFISKGNLRVGPDASSESPLVEATMALDPCEKGIKQRP